MKLLLTMLLIVTSTCVLANDKLTINNEIGFRAFVSPNTDGYIYKENSENGVIQPILKSNISYDLKCNSVLDLKISNINADTYLDNIQLINYLKITNYSFFKTQIGTINLNKGFFSDNNLAYESGVIFPNSAVYGEKFKSGLLRDYYGAKVTLDYTLEYSSFYLSYSKGEMRDVNKKLTEYAVYSINSDFTDIKQDSVESVEVGYKVNNFEAYYIKSVSQFYITETDYSKSLSLKNKYMLLKQYGSGATFIGAVDTPYVNTLERIGFTYESQKYALMFEKDWLSPSNSSKLPFKLYSSSGWFALARYYLSDKTDLAFSYGESRSPTDNVLNTDISMFASFGITNNTEISLEVHRISGQAYVEVYNLNEFKEHKESNESYIFLTEFIWRF